MKRSLLLPWLRSWSRRSYILHGILIAQMILLPCATSNGVWVPIDEDGDGFFENGYEDGQPEPDPNPPTPDADPEPEPPLPPNGDADGDGLNNADEAAADSDPYNPDSDYDGLTDSVETGLTGTDPTSSDSNSDGISDYNSFYGNTSVDTDVVGPGETPYDYDGDGIHDPTDPDPLSPDNDPDSDGDYVADSQDSDPTDPTEWNDANNNGTNDDAEIPNNDADSDGISNDTDSHPSDPSLSNDWNWNNTNDQDEDWDGDGVSNLQDSHPNSNCLWCDWNGNGVNDDSEAGTADSDGDGVADNSDSHSYNSSLWEDWNGNGANDSSESQDSDGDGHADSNDSDPQNGSLWEDWSRNGTNDSQETTTPPPSDRDSDGVTDDSDSDPDNSSLWSDWNRNGTNDGDETPPPDSDGDGSPDSSDTDPSDSNLWEDNNRNGYNDSNEDQFIDNDGDGRANATDSHPNDANLWNDQNGNGQNDEDEITIADTDGDGYADELDTHPDDAQRWNDHNNNGSNDELDVPLDTDSDGLPDNSDPYPLDSDNDGINNSEEIISGTNPNNADTDSDGSPDGIELFTGTSPSNVDTDSDGLTDNEEQQAYGTDPLVPTMLEFGPPEETPEEDQPEDAPTVEEVVIPAEANTPKIIVEESLGTVVSSGNYIEHGATINFPSASGQTTAIKSDLIKTITINNSGTSDLTGLALSKSGASPAEFTLSSLAVTSLPPGSKTSFTITFKAPIPTTQSRTAGLQITSNDPEQPTFHLILNSIVQTKLWVTHKVYFSANLFDTDSDGIPDLVEQMYAPFVTSTSQTPWSTVQWDFITPNGDLDGDGVNNLAQYLQGRDLRANVSTTDIDGDGIINTIEDDWAKKYGGAQSNKYRMADAFADPDGDGLLTIEELLCTWGSRTVKDPAAVATNPFMEATGPNLGTAAATYNLKARTVPPVTITAATKWADRESSPNYKAWMNDGLLRKACRETPAKTATGIVLPAFFVVKHLWKLPTTPTIPGDNLGHDHLPSGYLDWLVSKGIALPTANTPIAALPPPSLSDLRYPSQNTNISDADLDGMPNLWEAAYRLDWRDRGDASLDQASLAVSDRLRALPLAPLEKVQITDPAAGPRIIAAIKVKLSEKRSTENPLLIVEYDIAPPTAPKALAAKPTLDSKLPDWNKTRDTWEIDFIAHQTWQILNEIDQDHDGLANVDEHARRLNPTIADYHETASRDSDGDGFTDAQEVAAGTSSLNASKFPPFLLEIVSGHNQTGAGVLIHKELPEPIVLRALYKGIPQPKILINFKSSSVANQTLLAQVTEGPVDWNLNSIQVRTDANGLAKIRVKAPAAKGALTITANSVIRSAPIYLFKATTIAPTIPALDTDGDRMPDAWEDANKLKKLIALNAEESPLSLIPGYHRDTPSTKLSAAQLAILDLPREPSTDPAVPGLLKDYPPTGTSSLQTAAQIVILKAIDPDHDGLTNLQEFQRDSNPQVCEPATASVRDSDGDGFTNAEEIAAGTNPLLATSSPTFTIEVIDGDKQTAVRTSALEKPIKIRVSYKDTPREGVSLDISNALLGTAFANELDTETLNWIPKKITLSTNDQGMVSFFVKAPDFTKQELDTGLGAKELIMAVTSRWKLDKKPLQVSATLTRRGVVVEREVNLTVRNGDGQPAFPDRLLPRNLVLQVTRDWHDANDPTKKGSFPVNNAEVTFDAPAGFKFISLPYIVGGNTGHIVASNEAGTVMTRAISPTEGGVYNIRARTDHGKNVAVFRIVVGRRSANRSYDPNQEETNEDARLGIIRSNPDDPDPDYELKFQEPFAAAISETTYHGTRVAQLIAHKNILNSPLYEVFFGIQEYDPGYNDVYEHIAGAYNLGISGWRTESVAVSYTHRPEIIYPDDFSTYKYWTIPYKPGSSEASQFMPLFPSWNSVPDSEPYANPELAVGDVKRARLSKVRLIARDPSTDQFITLPKGAKRSFLAVEESGGNTKILKVVDLEILPNGYCSEGIGLNDVSNEIFPQSTAKTIRLLPIDLTGHRRGTFNAPGAVSAGGTFGKETVLLENADRDEGSATQRDLDTATLDKANDDDLVKVVLSFPANTKPAGVGLKLKHEGMKVDGTKTTFDSGVVRQGASRLNFYDDQGNKLTDADLKIDDLANPGSGYMAQIVTAGTLTLFVEGADNFGMVGDDEKSPTSAKYMGGALLTLEVTGTGAVANSGPRLLVFRGGFMRYRHPNGQPGELGTLEFRDGKGRITNDNTDLGTVIKTWSARSGKPGGAAYNVEDGNGHIPPGWRLIYERDDFPGTQPNQQAGTGNNLVVTQGSYCRWSQDDNAPGYTTPYIYRANDANDSQIGKPAMHDTTSSSGQTIMFKFQTEVIPPTSAANRSHIQFHPDGKKDGSAGCISIQSYDDCKEVYRYLYDYNALKLKVDLE